MDNRVEMLRRHIALYRRCLADGVPSDLALVYLAEIDKAELELEALRQGEAAMPHIKRAANSN